MPELLGVFEVDKEKRLRCQAPGCNHAVYKAVHLLSVEGEFKLYGSECCKKLFGWTSKTQGATHTSGERRLTDEEREQLLHNTAELLAKLKAEQAQLRAATESKLAALKAALAAKGSVVGTGRSRGESRMLGTVLSADVERQAKERVRARYQVDPDMAGWRGLVLAEAKKIEQGE
ncbi:hypothetical protein ABIC63_003414 [Pseudacidovorax sp. 1753]|uniref:hypothetical protein n=1 Tax=Pseudacidovorax sp. 1753 TaxID=3156419 RepID=UPI0033957BEC